MNDDKNVGQVIHNKRKELSLTQEDLAEKVHVTRQAVSNWERNKTVP
ncbi:helix-turn-helix transcriptional regulator, partial [Lactobacillus acetotolerans]